ISTAPPRVERSSRGLVFPNLAMPFGALWVVAADQRDPRLLRAPGLLLATRCSIETEATRREDPLDTAGRRRCRSPMAADAGSDQRPRRRQDGGRRRREATNRFQLGVYFG